MGDRHTGGQKETVLRRTGCSWGILLLTYIVENGSLLLQLSGGQGEEISHKSEYLLSPVDFFSQLKTNLLQGGQHSVDYHGLILVVLLMTTVVLFS